MNNYIPLHLHTDKSLMDGVATAEEYALRAAENGMTACGITDHGTLSNHRMFAKAMRDKDIKPIFGVEAYITGDIKDRRDRASRTEPLDRLYNHITLIAKNQQGYENLSRLNEIAWNEGYFHKPRIDFELLSKYSDGIIIGSACMGGLLNSAIEIGDFAVAKQHLGTLHEIAGDDFYIEVMPHNTSGVNRHLINLAKSYDIKCITTPDCHHAHVGQKVVQEIMLIANTHPKVLTDKDRTERAKAVVEGKLILPDVDYSMLSVADRNAMERFDYLYGVDRKMSFNKFDIHLLSAGEMIHGMDIDFADEFFNNTYEINEKVEDIEFPENLDLLPHLATNPDEVLRDKCLDQIRLRGLDERYSERLLNEELPVIEEKQFAQYFLIVEDIISWAREQGILVGPGRGSGGGSVINYLLSNSMVDPVENDLLFFRFIDPSRPDWPDFDMDFEDKRRGEVKAYVANKYGEENVASIATYQKFSDKGIIKDVARVFNIALTDVNKVSKLIDTWEEYKESPTVKWFRDKYPEVERYGEQLRGRTRGTGMHASGLVTSKIPLSDIAPMETRAPTGVKERMPVIAVDMDETADIGLIKLDILGLKALTTIHDTLDYIKDRTGRQIDLYDIPFDDPAVYDMLSAGHTQGVFQCEQAPYTKLLMQIGINSFDELAATNALVRPGAMKTIGKDYIARKQGRKHVSYIHKDTESFTQDTYGLVLYQEQQMLLCTRLAGMSMVEANKVRKITAKKKDPALLAEYKSKFVDGAAGKIGRPQAELLWDDLLKWAEYGFNKSHAVAYSFISYWTAWLKHNYPIEFMTATLNNEKDKDSRTQYLIEAKRMGITVKLPHINLSDIGFTIEDNSIRMGLSTIKYISENIASKYMAGRPFSTRQEVEDFTFTKGNGVNSRALAALDAVGALNIGDHKATDIKSNLYEYLNLPELSSTVPGHWEAFMTPTDEFDEVKTMLMMGIVTGIRRGQGWSLVSIMDKTGQIGVFDEEMTTLEKGKSYVFLVGNNRIMESVPLDGIRKSDSPIVSWLEQADDGCAADELSIIAFKSRTTKAGKRMGTIIASDSQRELVGITVFSTNFNTVFVRCKPGTKHRINYEEGRDGGFIFRSIE